MFLLLYNSTPFIWLTVNQSIANDLPLFQAFISKQATVKSQGLKTQS